MSTDDHPRKQKKGLFCAVAATPCECGNDYVAICDPGWKSQPSFAFSFKQRRTGTVVTKVFEAHHLLCVASVGKIIVGNEDIESVVIATKWCVNNKDNMYAMPLWGHTIKWYCDIGSTLSFTAGVEPPPFKNIPQHDWDHTGKGGYIEELDPELQAIADRIEKKKKQHAIAVKDLADSLTALAIDFGFRLKTRGIRLGGTQIGWNMGKKDKTNTSNWYHPFSMSAEPVISKGYPQINFNEEVLKKLKWLAGKLKGLGG